MKFQVGDKITNLKNNTFGEIRQIKKGVATVVCQEMIIGLFKITDKLVNEAATRTIHLGLLEKGIEDGLYKLN